MSQALGEPTMKDALLDLLLMNREGLMGDVMVGGCLAIVRKQVRGVATLKSAKFKLFRELISRVPWKSAFEFLGVDEI